MLVFDLSKNGMNSLDVLLVLYGVHVRGSHKVGMDLTRDDVWDHYVTNFWALKLLINIVWTVLQVDQIIMAKQASGPKPG